MKHRYDSSTNLDVEQEVDERGGHVELSERVKKELRTGRYGTDAERAARAAAARGAHRRSDRRADRDHELFAIDNFLEGETRICSCNLSPIFEQ